jgi:hypothetical protein
VSQNRMFCYWNPDTTYHSNSNRGLGICAICKISSVCSMTVSRLGTRGKSPGLWNNPVEPSDLRSNLKGMAARHEDRKLHNGFYVMLILLTNAGSSQPRC